MSEALSLIGRSEELFNNDYKANQAVLLDAVANAAFLVIGGAGSIGQAVVKEIFKLKPSKLHVVDLSENNLVELVRDLRSSLGYIEGNFQTFALDCGSSVFELMLKNEGPYDYILNLSALKHVRSEKDRYTLMRMIEVNILNPEKLTTWATKNRVGKYFCVSSDKAANPANMMGASKRIMELFLMRSSLRLPVSTARFANVAFSDGSLLHGFNQRLLKRQPLAAPKDVKRYFVTEREAGQLCLLSCLLGENRETFFPKLSANLHLITFAEIAVKYLEQRGFEAVACDSEEEARRKVDEYAAIGKWPCYFFDSDTTGEKDYEEFYTADETVDFERFADIGVIKNELPVSDHLLEYFLNKVNDLRLQSIWQREDLVSLFHEILPDFEHLEKGKYLDGRM